MPTATPDLTAVQDYVLDAIKQSQELALEAARTVADTVSPIVSALPDAPFADLLPDPAATVDAGFSFATEVLSAQRDFTRQLVDLVSGGSSAEAS